MAALLGPAALGAVAGVAAQLQQSALWQASAYLGLLVAGALGLWGAWRLRRVAAGNVWAPSSWGLHLLAASLLGAAGSGLQALHRADDALAPELEGVWLQVVGTVEGLPQRGALGWSLVLRVESAHTRQGESVRLPTRLRLSAFEAGARRANAAPARADGPSPWRAGERWRLTVRLKRPHGPFNPHGHDRERMLWERGIGATGSVATGARAAAPQRLAPAPAWGVDVARQALGEAIARAVPEARLAGVLTALWVGDGSAIEREDWAVFRATGVAHLMVISGLHITAMAWLAMAVFGGLWAWLGRRWPSLLLACPTSRAAAWAGLGMAAAYAVFSGLGLPVQRALIMLAVGLGLRQSARRWPWTEVASAAVLAVLLVEPMAVLQPGFWLSFVAVGLLLAHAPAAASQARVSASEADPRPWLHALGASLGGMMRTQAMISLALAPLTLAWFGQFSLVGLLANLVAIPVVGWVVLPLDALGLLWSPFWGLAAWVLSGLMALLEIMAAWPLAEVHRPAPPWPLAWLAVIGGWVLVQPWPPSLRAAGLLLLGPALFGGAATRPASGQFEVLALDVGQGGAVLVRTAGHTLLYDSGPAYAGGGDAGERLVVPTLRALGERPDRVIVSHEDADHAGGSEAVAKAFPKASWWSSFDPDPARRCVAGQRWTWDGVHFEVLHPGPDAWASGPGGRRLSSNAMSCVLRIDNGRDSAWLSGDLDAAHEVRLALARPALRATLMLAPHHGSHTSSSPVLLNTLRPRWVMVQAGYRNPFGHPSERVVQRWRERGLSWVETPFCGAALWRSERPSEMHCERASRRRFWHHNGAQAAGERGDGAPPGPS